MLECDVQKFAGYDATTIHKGNAAKYQHFCTEIN